MYTAGQAKMIYPSLMLKTKAKLMHVHSSASTLYIANLSATGDMKSLFVWQMEILALIIACYDGL